MPLPPFTKLFIHEPCRFNKRREDFPDLRSYNDYLEEVEDISESHPENSASQLSDHICKAFNLINGIDLAGTEARINQYRLENAALIELNIQRDQRDIAGLMEEETRDRLEREERAEEQRRLDEEQRLEKEREKEDIISQLVRYLHFPQSTDINHVFPS